MTKPESRFWKKLKKKLPQGMSAHIIRVENPAHPGTPDVNMCVGGVEVWPELKRVPALPARPETPVFTGVMRAEQRLWHVERSKAGGRSYLVGYVEKEDIIYVIPGKYVMEFEKMSKERLDELNLPLEAMWSKEVSS